MMIEQRLTTVFDNGLDEKFSIALSETSLLMMVSARISDHLCRVRDTVDDGKIT